MGWLFRRAAAVVLHRLGTFAVAATGIVLVTALYLAGQHYFQDAERRAGELGELIQLREEQLARLAQERERIFSDAARALEAAEDRMATYRRELDSRRRQINELNQRLDRFRGWWLWIRSWVSSEAVREQAEQESRRRTLLAEVDQAERQLARMAQEAGVLRDEVGVRSEAILAEEAALGAEAERYRRDEAEMLRIAADRRQVLDATLLWIGEGYRHAGPLLLLLAVSIFMAPPLAKLGLFFAWAPLLERARPVRLARTPPGPPPVRVSRSKPALDLEVAPDECVVLHHDYYQASDEELEKKTRFLLDWRFPVTSLACRLAMLTEVTPTGTTPAHITVSNQEDPACELSRIDLPAGASVVLRPLHLVALRYPASQAPRIRSHWRLGRLHAWITLQFRYFEWLGPCSLVVRGVRGLRAETLQDDVSPARARRTSQLATIGFTPSLAYHSRRAETFWSYFTGKNPLFDDVFSGRGVFLCQQVSRDESRTRPGAFWRGVGNAFLKAFGA